ncbi:MAG: geranylgeranylglycerol-phosphate geranylgeranyltransferase [Crocinitomicaceae bacterium]
MQIIYHFFRLVRGLNLVVIALTMTIIQYFLSKYLVMGTNIYAEVSAQPTVKSIIAHAFSFEFILLVSLSVLFAAAANIINDYFDVRADRVNKPDRLIIGVHLKRRWAMVWHWAFNVIGFGISLYLGYLLNALYIPIVAFITVNLLWFYSAYFKRQPFTGNLLVAAFTGFVPVAVVLFNLTVTPNFSNPSVFIVLADYQYFFMVVLFTGVLAFLMNLIRELVKDVIDVRGDLKLGAKTFPIAYGIKKTRKLIFLLYVLLYIAGGFFVFYIAQILMQVMISIPRINNPINLYYFGGLLGGSLLFLTIAAFFTFRKHQISSYKKASNFLKAAMVFGLLIPLFL